MTGIAQVVFPHQANGSLIVKDGKAVGSALIGQPFDDPKYFWGRPSATAPFPYNAARLVGLEPRADEPGARRKAVQERVEALRAADPGNTAPVPVDLVTASAAGSTRTSARRRRSTRCAAWRSARELDAAAVRALVERHTEGRHASASSASRGSTCSR